MEILHNNTVTDMDGLSPEELKDYYDKNPWKYYQNYVAGSISPYYDAKLACIGASEELCELLSSFDRDAILSEAGDVLFQLVNIANFHNITISEEDFQHFSNKDDFELTFNLFVQSFGDVLSVIMKMSRYPDYQEVFQKKWGMTAEERIKLKLCETIFSLSNYVYTLFKLTLKDIMDYNLHKLDERHSKDGEYYFSSGFRNTLSNGSTTNR